MATVKKNRTAQYPLVAEFKFNLADAMLDVNGNVTNFNAVNGVFEPIALPVGAVIIGGEVVVETASNTAGATSTISVGSAANPTLYLGATSMKAAARTALVPTGYRTNDEDVRMTIANASADATAGVVTLRVQYIVGGRAQEVQIA